MIFVLYIMQFKLLWVAEGHWTKREMLRVKRGIKGWGERVTHLQLQGHLEQVIQREVSL